MNPDLTQRPPRSPRVRLGGYVLLPRLIDKARATLAGTPGAYHYNCPLDQRFFQFTGIDPEALKVEIARNAGDGAILAWVQATAPHRRSDWEIAQWSSVREAAVPADNESREYVSQQLGQAGAGAREDVATWFEYLDVDDHVSFGGMA